MVLSPLRLQRLSPFQVSLFLHLRAQQSHTSLLCVQAGDNNVEAATRIPASLGIQSITGRQETSVWKETTEQRARDPHICICPHAPPRQAVICVFLSECYSPELVPPAAYLYLHSGLSPAEVIYIWLDIYTCSLCLCHIRLQTLELRLDRRQLIHEQKVKEWNF